MNKRGHATLSRRKHVEYGGGGIGMVDGTLIPLAFKPSWETQAFNSRKMFHAISVQIINMPDLRIIDMAGPYPGSTGDALAWHNARPARERDHLLGPGEYDPFRPTDLDREVLDEAEELPPAKALWIGELQGVGFGS
ncbi:hypothetical protein JCM3774_001007 [Rhodotorula dairenensis]